MLLELRPAVTAGAYDPEGVTVSTAFVFAIPFTSLGSLAGLAGAAVGILVGRLPVLALSWCVCFVANLAKVGLAISLRAQTRWWDETRCGT